MTSKPTAAAGRCGGCHSHAVALELGTRLPFSSDGPHSVTDGKQPGAPASHVGKARTVGKGEEQGWVMGATGGRAQREGEQAQSYSVHPHRGWSWQDTCTA